MAEASHLSCFYSWTKLNQLLVGHIRNFDGQNRHSDSIIDQSHFVLVGDSELVIGLFPTDRTVDLANSSGRREVEAHGGRFRDLSANALDL